MFCQTDLYDNPIRISSPTPTSHRGRTRYSRASKRKKAEIGEYVKSVLPKGCDFVGMTTDGIVGRYWNSISQEMNCRSFHSKASFVMFFS